MGAQKYRGVALAVYLTAIKVFRLFFDVSKTVNLFQGPQKPGKRFSIATKNTTINNRFGKSEFIIEAKNRKLQILSTANLSAWISNALQIELNQISRLSSW